jgi:hypothetical protein
MEWEEYVQNRGEGRGGGVTKRYLLGERGKIVASLTLVADVQRKDLVAGRGGHVRVHACGCVCCVRVCVCVHVRACVVCTPADDRL